MLNGVGKKATSPDVCTYSTL